MKPRLVLVSRSSHGYTLVELLVVMAVLATLAAMAMPMAEVVAQREREQELKRSLWEIRDAIDSYRRARESGALSADSGTSPYPSSLDALTQLGFDARAATKGQPLRFLRRVPRDPFADPSLPTSWAQRSFLSDADNPKAGADVYDVFSRSERKALNGTALKDW
jgi:general secretion pathway protein G